MAGVVPGYLFSSANDPITWTKLNLIAQPTVTIGVNEITTNMISNYAVTNSKLQQQTGAGFLGRTAATLGDVSFVTLSDGNIAWPTTGIAISSNIGGQFSLGVSTNQQMRNLFTAGASTPLATNIGKIGDTNILYGSGGWDITCGQVRVFSGDGASSASQAFGIVPQGSGVTAGTDVVVGAAALATTAANGFFYLQSMAGTPTGAADNYAGRAACVIDTAATKLWVRIAGTWRYVTLT